MALFVKYLIVLLSVFNILFGQLIVNVKNKGGDIEKEKIEANITSDSVRLEYMPKDGTYISQFIDYKSVSSSLL